VSFATLVVDELHDIGIATIIVTSAAMTRLYPLFVIVCLE